MFIAGGGPPLIMPKGVKSMPAVTIVIRAKNEEFWMRRLLAQIQIQSFQDFELVLVDNQSTDRTREIFQRYVPAGKIIAIENYRPGQAINLGVAAGSAPLAVILSAHCIPVDEHWLSSFVEVLQDQAIAAAYGRQLPLPTSHPLDKRDLLNTFGIERRIQRKDTFFHNANSILRRDVWKKFPFDEETLHIEDRIWAGQIIQNGLALAYEPEAAVYHHHGINHHSDTVRAHVISDILTKQTFENGHSVPDFMLPSASDTLYCFLGHDESTDEKFKQLLQDTKAQCPAGRYTVHSQAPQLFLGQEPDLEILPRTPEDNDLTFIDILRKMLHRAYQNGIYLDCIVYLNLRLDRVKAHHVNKSVGYFYRGMYDSVFFAEEDYRNVWQKNGESYQQIKPNYAPKGLKDPIYLALYGQGLATKPLFIETGTLVGTHVAILNYGQEEVQTDSVQTQSADFEGLRLAKGI